MIDSPYFKIEPYKPSGASDKTADEILTGDYWGVSLTDGNYVLRYISGAHLGDEKQLALSNAEFLALSENPDCILEILIKHGVG
jgi:hypothetical protein